MSHKQASQLPFNDVEASVLEAWPRFPSSRERLLLAVSGGADSVAMFRVILRMHGQASLVEVAHFNHLLRGAESDADEAFVQNLCGHHAVNCWIGKPEKNGPPIQSEDSARVARYRFLEQTAYRIGARYVLTAHTASDRAETMLHNLFRGTGLTGVRSIQATRNLGSELVVVRPLIRCSRKNVIDYLAELGQDFRHDSSNRDVSFRRNQIRHEILPAIRSSYGDRLDERLLAFADEIAELEAWILGMAEQYLEQVEQLLAERFGTVRQFGAHDREICLPRNQILPVDWPVLRSALSIRYHQLDWPLGKMSRGHWNTVRAMHQQTGNESPSLNLPGGLELSLQEDWLFIRRPGP
ncbi:MAG: tRNA lysidine(34) synthetase TilS [bacterium]|nr:tRNA lysidine(34) synthetase TilS [bacterium]